MATRPLPPRRTAFRRFHSITPRWNDNDVFGHINNAEYYGFFDTTVMRFIVDEGVIPIGGSDTGVVIVESGCNFHREVTFRDQINVGLAVAHIGSSSVRYELGLFINDDESAAAAGYFVHVFVDRRSMRPISMPSTARRLFEGLMPPPRAA